MKYIIFARSIDTAKAKIFLCPIVMQCPKCKDPDTKVIDTRVTRNQFSIRRRRQCIQCNHRFGTIEELVKDELSVIKRDGRRVAFDRTKLIVSLQKATEKRSFTTEQIESIATEIIENLMENYYQEIPSAAIGHEVMNLLRRYDQMAYLRFASVYKNFNNVSEFAEEISTLKVEEVQ